MGEMRRHALRKSPSELGIDPKDPESGRPVEEEYVFVFRDGEDRELMASRVAPGLYRLHECFRFAIYAGGAEEEVPDDAGVGWLLVVDEQWDGRLVVEHVVRDPSVDCTGPLSMPLEITESPAFQRMSGQILELGGHWEIGFGLFSAYVPKGVAGEAGFVLGRAVGEVRRAFLESEGDAGWRVRCSAGGVPLVEAV